MKRVIAPRLMNRGAVQFLSSWSNCFWAISSAVGIAAPGL